ncbi:RagB/SusD family nutrient uptake outer membrane protein [Nibrella viscosa]|uniref:RagB/SusD family nutrient uptake outer membrane protein n=1 Tax=Nibrella viscosa TaxID=1084524 RepID=A0ABP8JTT7_9BACT
MKNISKYSLLLTLGLVGLFSNACKDEFLDRPPIGVFSEEALRTKAGVQGMLIAAYTGLNGAMYGSGSSAGADVSTFSNWVFGSLTSDDAQKGADVGGSRSNIERYEIAADNTKLDDRWRFVYDGIARCNDVLRVAPTVKDFTDTELKNILGQARTLRAVYYFHGTVVFGRMPWIDEKTTDYLQPNERVLWKEMEEDAKFGYDNLPETFPELGRVNKWMAGVMLAKLYVFQKKWAEAKPLLDVIIANGRTTRGVKYALLPRYHDNFRIVTQGTNTDSESVLDAQYSVNDNGRGYNGGLGDNLNFPHGGLPSQPGGCCGYHQPSQDLVNAYQTDANGLPLLDNHNKTEVKSDEGIESNQPFTPHQGPLDPRLDWTVGRRGIPYLDWGPHPGKAWIRDQNYAGPFSPKKNVYYKADEGVFTEGTSRQISANNVRIIRFAEVLLMAAETEAELGNLEKAREYINQIRRRAANPDGFVKMPDGKAAANYVIQEYKEPWADKAFALKAIRFERRLELGMEGQRFFDLVRWGIAKEVLNNYLTYETTKRANLKGAVFRDHNVLFPVPQRQIDATKRPDGTPTLTQNPGY